MLYIGTSGFSYDDWVGPFYPSGTPKREFLGFYAGEFDTVELNASYYRLPEKRFITALSRKTPPNFVFFIKAFQGLTHRITDQTPSQLEQFKAALSPLEDAGKLGGVLLQFPYSFHPTDGNRAHLDSLLNSLGPLRPVVEFRNREWLTEPVLDLLADRDAGFCSVDQPALRGLLPSEAIVTSRQVGYVRFHGRNREKWWEHDEAWERYDYLYGESELGEWTEKIRKMTERAEKTYVYFNNHRNAQAVINARQMKLLLGVAEEA